MSLLASPGPASSSLFITLERVQVGILPKGGTAQSCWVPVTRYLQVKHHPHPRPYPGSNQDLLRLPFLGKKKAQILKLIRPALRSCVASEKSLDLSELFFPPPVRGG